MRIPCEDEGYGEDKPGPGRMPLVAVQGRPGPPEAVSSDTVTERIVQTRTTPYVPSPTRGIAK